MSVLVATFPTDRAEDAPDLGVGVDSLAVRAPTTERLLEALPNRRMQTIFDDMTGEVTDLIQGGRLPLPIGLGYARVYADRRNGQPELHVEVSAPTMLNGHNVVPLRPDLVPDIVDVLLSVLAEDLPDVPEPDAARLVRLDLVRDFLGVENPSAILEAVARRPIPAARRHHEERDAITGRLQTLTRGSISQWLARGYDKAHELSSAAQRERDPDRRELLKAWSEHSNGHLRFEVELKADWIRRNGMQQPETVTPERAMAVAQGFFERSRYGDVFAGQGRVTEALSTLVDAGRMTEARGVAAVLIGDLIGRQLHSRKQQQTYRALARRLGLAAADLDAPGEEPRRLDFGSGREIVGHDALD